MAFPIRDYLRLEEVSERWSVSQEDILDCAMRDILNLSVFICNTPLIYGEYKVGSDGRPFPVHADRIRYSGLQKLTIDDLFRIRQAGETQVATFKPFNGYQYVLIGEDALPLHFRINDIVVDSPECQRFEEEYGLSPANDDQRKPFNHENEFRIVTLEGCTWHLGDTQARVIAELYKAATQTDNPWLHGKRLLQEAGSNAFRMRDLFSSQPNWQKLITSNQRGYYRLNLPGLSAK